MNPRDAVTRRGAVPPSPRIPIAFALALLAAAASAPGEGRSEPPRNVPEQDQDPAGRPPVGAEDRALALRDLRALAERHRGVKVLTAHYVQRRTTKLLKEPLVTEGELAFRRSPGTILFRTAPPRPAEVRLDERIYEVHRPQRRRLERFALPSPELPRALFAALGGDAEALAQDFAVVAFERIPAPADTTGTAGAGEPTERIGERHRIALAPRDEAVRERMQDLVLVLDADDAHLRSVAYRDPAGDLVQIELSSIEFDPEVLPSFVIEVPPGTQVVEHAPPRRDR